MSTFTRNQTFVDGTPAYAEDLHALIEKSTLNAGAVGNDELADQCVNPSKWGRNVISNDLMEQVPPLTLKAKLADRTGAVDDQTLPDVNDALMLPRVDVFSAGSTVIGQALAGDSDSPYLNITGNAPLTSFDAMPAGTVRTMIFDPAPAPAIPVLLTHNATKFILPAGNNIPTQAGDMAQFISEGSGNWRLLKYFCVINLENGDTETAYRGFDFSYQIVTSHGGGFFTSSTLPAGLTLNRNTGVISGRATTLGTYTIDIYQTLSLVKAHAQVTITVLPGVTDQTLNGDAGFAISYQLTAQVVPAPTTWAVSSLPSGVSVASGTGLITGTPTDAFIGDVTVTVSNANGSDTATLHCNIRMLKVEFLPGGGPGGGSTSWSSLTVSIDGGTPFTPTFSINTYPTPTHNWYYMRSGFTVHGTATMAADTGLSPSFGIPMNFVQSGRTAVRAHGDYLLNWPGTPYDTNSVVVALQDDNGYNVYAGLTQSNQSFGATFDLPGIDVFHHNIAIDAQVSNYGNPFYPICPAGTVFGFNAEFDFT